MKRILLSGMVALVVLFVVGSPPLKFDFGIQDFECCSVVVDGGPKPPPPIEEASILEWQDEVDPCVFRRWDV